MSKNKQAGQVPHAHHPHHSQRGQSLKNVNADQEREHAERDELEITGITISIDTRRYYAFNEKLSGAELLNLSIPLKGSDKELFSVAAVECEDIVLSNTDMIEVSTREADLCPCVFSDTIMPTKEEVEKSAYFIYLKQGGQPGHDLENWAEAEALLTLHPE